MFERRWFLHPTAIRHPPARVVGVCLSGDGYCTQVRTTSPCGGRRSLFFASAKKTNEKKADPAGGRAIRLSNIDDFVVQPRVPAGFCRYRLDWPRSCQLPGFVVRPPVADITCFKPSVARVVAGHEVAGAPVPSWARWHRVICPRPSPPRPPHHETMGMWCVVVVRAGNGRCGNGHCARGRGHHHETHGSCHCEALQTGNGSCQQNCGRTTKPAPLALAIALLPAGSAFFSLVFFAEAKKSDRRPPQGDVVRTWVQ